MNLNFRRWSWSCDQFFLHAGCVEIFPAKMGSRVEPKWFRGGDPALGCGILEVVNRNPNRKSGSVGGLGCYKIGTEAPNPQRRQTDVDSYY